MTPEQFRTLLTVLQRIVDAFEEQNRMIAKSLEEQAARDERMITLHAVSIEREHAWREMQRKMWEAATHE